MSTGTTEAGGQVTYEAIEPPDVLPPAYKAQDEQAAKPRWHKLTAFLVTQAVLTGVAIFGAVQAPDSVSLIVATFAGASSANLVTFVTGNASEHKAKALALLDKRGK